MEGMDEIRRHFGFTAQDEENLKVLAEILLPFTQDFSNAFYEFLVEDPHMALFFKTEAAIQKRKGTIGVWFKDLLTGSYNIVHLMKLKRIGEVHVRIGLKGHYVNAAMHFVRSYCLRQTVVLADPERRTDLLETLNRVIDLNLNVMTSSYRDAELKKVFFSYKTDSALIRWSERMVQGLNLVLMIGMVLMSVGVVSL